MFALIWWTDSQEISVVPIEDTKKVSANSFQAKWGNHWYPAEILKTSGNFENSFKFFSCKILINNVFIR